MDTDGLESRIYTIPPPFFPSLPPPPIDYAGTESDIIIDNGSTTFRWGFTQHEPRTAPNVVARYKERRNNRPLLLFGEAVDCESGARGQARTPWEGDVLLNFDALVCCSISYISLLSTYHRLGKRARLCFPSAGDSYTHRRPSYLYD